MLRRNTPYGNIIYMLRASLCKILISSFAHKMDFAHNLSLNLQHVFTATKNRICHMVQIKRISHTKQIKRNFPNCIEMKYNLNVIKCYVMLCYVMICYVMLCYVMLCLLCLLCYVMLLLCCCYVMLCYVMLCYMFVMLCYVMLCYVMHK